jgi:hypothetical protein
MNNTELQSLLMVRCHLRQLLGSKRISKAQAKGVLRSLKKGHA